jgi:histidine triad (HIT) family protein
MLYSLSRTWLGGIVFGWVLAHFSFALPVDRLLETETLIAFEHPRPSHPIHILIVPKGRYRNLFELPSDATDFPQELFEAVRKLVEQHGLEEVGYQLIMNGGSNQEVDHLHFHLVGGDADQQEADDLAR